MNRCTHRGQNSKRAGIPAGELGRDKGTGVSRSKALLGAGETVTGEAREVARNQVTQRQLTTG